jgi:hypothetical protein
MCGTIDHGSYIRWILGFDIKTGYDRNVWRKHDVFMQRYKLSKIWNPVYKITYHYESEKGKTIATEENQYEKITYKPTNQ